MIVLLLNFPLVPCFLAYWLNLIPASDLANKTWQFAMLIFKLYYLKLISIQYNCRPFSLSDWLKNIKLAQSEYTWSKNIIYQSAIMIHVVCVFLIRLKINRQQLRDWRLKRILWVMRLFRYVLLLRPVTRIWDQSSSSVVTTIAGHANDLYQMSSNVTFQLYTPPKFSTLRQIHKFRNPPKNSGRGHPAINLITNFARGWIQKSHCGIQVQNN